MFKCLDVSGQANVFPQTLPQNPTINEGPNMTVELHKHFLARRKNY